MLRSMFAVALGFAAVSAQADPSPQVQAPAAQTAPVKQKRICRAEASTGSIMTKRTCHTQAEWDALAQANNGTLNDLRSQRQIQQNTNNMRN